MAVCTYAGPGEAVQAGHALPEAHASLTGPFSHMYVYRFPSIHFCACWPAYTQALERQFRLIMEESGGPQVTRFAYWSTIRWE